MNSRGYFPFVCERQAHCVCELRTLVFTCLQWNTEYGTKTVCCVGVLLPTLRKAGFHQSSQWPRTEWKRSNLRCRGCADRWYGCQPYLVKRLQYSSTSQRSPVSKAQGSDSERVDTKLTRLSSDRTWVRIQFIWWSIVYIVRLSKDQVDCAGRLTYVIHP